MDFSLLFLASALHVYISLSFSHHCVQVVLALCEYQLLILKDVSHNSAKTYDILHALLSQKALMLSLLLAVTHSHVYDASSLPHFEGLLI